MNNKKQITLSGLVLLLSLILPKLTSAQAPQKMSYQAVIRNSSNTLIVSSPIGMKVSVVQGTSAGTVAFSETHTATTNVNGLVSLEIGTGTATFGTFSGIDWANGPYFIKTEIDPTGGINYTISGTTELMSVPYAMYALNSPSGKNSVLKTTLELAGPNCTSGGSKIEGGLDVNGNGILDNSEIDPALTRYVCNGNENTNGLVLGDMNGILAPYYLNSSAAVDLPLKENIINKSTDGTLGANSDVNYPSEKAVKTYVDGANLSQSTALTAEISRATAAENALNASILNEQLIRTNADAILTSDLQSEISNRVSSDINLTNSIYTETTNRINGDVNLSSNLNTEVLRATAAELTKENLSNKSIDGTFTSNSDINYPSVRAAKTYVDASYNLNNSNLNAEISRATAAEGVLTTNLATETTNRIAGDAASSSSITAEVTRATAAEGVLTTNLSSEVTRATNAEATKEDVANKSIDGTFAANSDVKYPSEKAVKTYVSSVLLAGTPDATTASKGKIQLAGDLTGTAALPTISNSAITNIKVSPTANIDASKLGTGIVSNTEFNYVDGATSNIQTQINTKANISSPSFTGTPLAPTAAAGTSTTQLATTAFVTSANNLKANIASPALTGVPSAPTAATGTSTTQLATTAFVTAAVSAVALSATPDATTLAKGKIQLAGDLSGTSALPTIASNAITTVKILDANVTDAKILTVSGTKVTGNISGNASNVSGVVAIANGGTGSATQNFVDLSTTQTIGGAKTFSSTVTASGLTVGGVTYPNSVGTSGQVLSSDGTGVSTWTTPTTTTTLATTLEATGQSLSSSNSGTVFYTQANALPSFSETLPDGYNCVIINYSFTTYTSNVLSTAKYFSSTIGSTGASTFTIPPGGSVKINVVTIAGQKCYFIQ